MSTREMPLLGKYLIEYGAMETEWPQLYGWASAAQTKAAPAVGMSAVKESDPTGRAPSEPGAKLDAGKLRADLMLDGFPRALIAVAEVATYGAAKYTEHGWVDVPDGETRYRAAGDRHRLARSIDGVDDDSGLYHLAHEAWNRLAELELMLRAIENA